MATRAAGKRDVGTSAEGIGDRMVGLHDETRMGLLTSEFWIALVAAVAVLIAAAVSPILDARSAWWIVGVIAAAYVVSRGIAKSGRGHIPGSVWERISR
jgi:hypothetical protein